MNITVVNDVHEGGVEFERDLYTVEVSESARAGDTLLALRARVRPPPGAPLAAPRVAAPEPRLLYGILAARVPTDAALFRLHELTGVLELARPLDRCAPPALTV